MDIYELLNSNNHHLNCFNISAIQESKSLKRDREQDSLECNDSLTPNPSQNKMSKTLDQLDTSNRECDGKGEISASNAPTPVLNTCVEVNASTKIVNSLLDYMTSSSSCAKLECVKLKSGMFVTSFMRASWNSKSPTPVKLTNLVGVTQRLVQQEEERARIEDEEENLMNSVADWNSPAIEWKTLPDTDSDSTFHDVYDGCKNKAKTWEEMVHHLQCVQRRPRFQAFDLNVFLKLKLKERSHLLSEYYINDSYKVLQEDASRREALGELLYLCAKMHESEKDETECRLDGVFHRAVMLYDSCLDKLMTLNVEHTFHIDNQPSDSKLYCQTNDQLSVYQSDSFTADELFTIDVSSGRKTCVLKRDKMINVVFVVFVMAMQLDEGSDGVIELFDTDLYDIWVKKGFMACLSFRAASASRTDTGCPQPTDEQLKQEHERMTKEHKSVFVKECQRLRRIVNTELVDYNGSKMGHMHAMHEQTCYEYTQHILHFYVKTLKMKIAPRANLKQDDVSNSAFIQRFSDLGLYASYICSIVALDRSMLGRSESLKAAAVAYIIFFIMYDKRIDWTWEQSFGKFTGYSKSDIRYCVKDILSLYKNAQTQHANTQHMGEMIIHDAHFNSIVFAYYDAHNQAKVYNKAIVDSYPDIEIDFHRPRSSSSRTVVGNTNNAVVSMRDVDLCVHRLRAICAT
jgi:hypothetical protein